MLEWVDTRLGKVGGSDVYEDYNDASNSFCIWIFWNAGTILWAGVGMLKLSNGRSDRQMCQTETGQARAMIWVAPNDQDRSDCLEVQGFLFPVIWRFLS